MEDRDRIVELVEGSDMIFITAGMGGGTGTGAAPVVAQVAPELGILTVAVVTKPFEMEGNKRHGRRPGIGELGKYVDSLITIPNQKLLTVLGGDTTLLDAFKAANHVLQGAVQGIAELITRPGLINVDFADVRTVMAETGMAMMGSGAATGENRARAAAEAAISSPLLEDVNLSGAHGLLINVTAGMDLRDQRVPRRRRHDQAVRLRGRDGVVGTVIDPEMTDQIRVTVVATGIRPAGGIRGQRRRAQPKVEVVAGGRAQRRPVDPAADGQLRRLRRRRPRSVAGSGWWARTPFGRHRRVAARHPGLPAAAGGLTGGRAADRVAREPQSLQSTTWGGR